MSHERRGHGHDFSATAECPKIEELEQMLEAHPSARMQKHVSGCPTCQAELRMMRSFFDGQPTQAEGEPLQAVLDSLLESQNLPDVRALTESHPQRLKKRNWWESLFVPSPALAMGVFAILVIVVGVAVLKRPSVPNLTNPGDPTLRGGRLELIAPRGAVSGPISTFQWQPVENASVYRVILLTVDGRRLVISETHSDQISTPEEFIENLLPGKTLLWQVEARDPEGVTLAESERVRIRIENQP